MLNLEIMEFLKADIYTCTVEKSLKWLGIKGLNPLCGELSFREGAEKSKIAATLA